MPRVWDIDLPDFGPARPIASCTRCGCLVVMLEYFRAEDGWIEWDPSHSERRGVVARLGAALVASWRNQAWGCCYSMPHLCPPGEYPQLWDGSGAVEPLPAVPRTMRGLIGDWLSARPGAVERLATALNVTGPVIECGWVIWFRRRGIRMSRRRAYQLAGRDPSRIPPDRVLSEMWGLPLACETPIPRGRGGVDDGR